MHFNELVVSMFEKIAVDLDDVYESAKLESLREWEEKQENWVTGSGSACAAIPGLHLGMLAGDLLFLMNRMSVACYGIGSIVGQQLGRGNILEKDDFALVMALWAGDMELKASISTQRAAEVAATVVNKSVAKSLAHMMLSGSGYRSGPKLSEKFGTKIGAKFGSKLGGKAAAGFIPFLGPLVSGGINFYFLSSICAAAEDFYYFKCEVLEKAHREPSAQGSV